MLDFEVFNLYNNLGSINSIINSYAAVNPYGIDERILNSSKLDYVNFNYFYQVSWRHCQFKLVEQGYYPGSLRFLLNDKFFEYCQGQPDGFVPTCTSNYRHYMSTMNNDLTVNGYYQIFLGSKEVISIARLVTNNRQFLNAVFNLLIIDIKLGWKPNLPYTNRAQAAIDFLSDYSL